METTKPDAVNEELIAKSRTRSIDELRTKGDRVKVIRATDVTAMISETVHRVLRDCDALSDEDIDILVKQGAHEFRKVFTARKIERERAEQKFRDVQEELHAARLRIRELEEILSNSVERRSDRKPESSAELMMRMMTEMAEMKAELQLASGTYPAAQPASGTHPAATPNQEAPADAVTQALDAISSNLNKRLEQFGKKMGISAAVETEVKYETLFDSDEADMESNMGDVELKKATGGGIAGNLAKLKKMKGEG